MHPIFIIYFRSETSPSCVAQLLLNYYVLHASCHLPYRTGTLIESSQNALIASTMTAPQPSQDPFLNGKPNHDSLQNLSFMYQANIYLNGLGILPSRTRPQSSEAGPSCVKYNKKHAELRAGETKSGEEEEGSLSGVARRANRGYEYATQHSMLKTYVSPVSR